MKCLSLFILILVCTISTVSCSSEGAEGKVPAQIALCFLFFALLVGALVTYLLSRSGTELPYTVVVFAFGVIVAAGFRYVSEVDILKESIDIWDSFQPHLILFVFLPALLFGESMSLNFHHVRSALVSSLLLAGPGAVFGTFALGVVAKYVLPYDWSWSLCFVFGAILCATDPVAVVALLKKAGASSRLTYLIIGEALLNDGVALVLYNLLFTLLKINNTHNKDIEPLNVFLYFLKVIFISPLLGLAFGVGSLVFLSLANRRMHEEDATIQMAVTICCAYLSFFVGEQVLGVSGVITCCSAGVFLSHYAPPLILHQDAMHSIWSAFEWIGNTLIFSLAGLIIGSRSILYVHARDVAYIVVIYLFIIIRAIMMLICFPVLCRIGKQCTPQEAVFITWGGLRGALSMAIALSLWRSVEEGDTVVTLLEAHRVFILVGGTAALTLIINATLSNTVLEYLGLVSGDTTEEAHIMYHYVKKRIFKKASHLLDQTTKNTNGNGGGVVAAYSCNRQLVVGYCSILTTFTHDQTHDINVSPSKKPKEPSPNTTTTTTSSEHHFSFEPRNRGETLDAHHAMIGSDDAALFPYAPILNSTSLKARSHPVHLLREESRTRKHSMVHAFYHPITPRTGAALRHGEEDEEMEVNDRPPIDQLLSQVRRAFLEVVRVNYWKQINSGKLPRKSTATLALLNSIDVGLETTHTPGLQDWDELVRTNRVLFAEHQTDSTNEVDNTGDRPASQSTADRGRDTPTRFAASPSPRLEIDCDLEAPVAGQSTNGGEGNFSTKLNNISGASRRVAFQTLRNRAMSMMTVYDGQAELDASSVDHAGTHFSDQHHKQRTTAEFIRHTIGEYYVAKKVYILTSFIEAHEYAQHKIPFYLGESESIDTPEESMVVNESKELVRQAKLRLAEIDSNVITLQVSKQTARWILHVQEDMVAEFQREGILDERDASLLLKEVQKDLNKLGNVEWSSIILSKLIHRLESAVSHACLHPSSLLACCVKSHSRDDVKGQNSHSDLLSVKREEEDDRESDKHSVCSAHSHENYSMKVDEERRASGFHPEGHIGGA